VAATPPSLQNGRLAAPRRDPEESAKMSNKTARRLQALIPQAVMAEAQDSSPESPSLERIDFSAELAACAEPAGSPTPQPFMAASAAFLDGTLSRAEAEPVLRHLAESPAARLEFEAVVELLGAESIGQGAPEDLVSAALSVLELPPGVTVLSRWPAPRSLPASESFLALAAASAGEQRPVYCRSRSGIWTLEVFIEEPSEDPLDRRAQLLLTLQAEHRASYEGLTARVFVGSSEDTSVLTEQTVRNGEIYAEFELQDLDFWTRDAVSVVFEPATGPQD
jgi:hypothetical protein